MFLKQSEAGINKYLKIATKRVVTLLEAQIWDPLDGRIPLLHVAVELSEEPLLRLCAL